MFRFPDEHDKSLFVPQLNAVFQEAFSRHDAYKTALKYAFEDIMNKLGNRLAELMAKYIDTKLKGAKGVTDEKETAIANIP